MGVNDGYKLFSRLESTSKNLSNGVLKSKIEQSYEAVVISIVGLNWSSGNSLKDLSKESQKSLSRPQNAKI